MLKYSFYFHGFHFAEIAKSLSTGWVSWKFSKGSYIQILKAFKSTKIYCTVDILYTLNTIKIFIYHWLQQKHDNAQFHKVEEQHHQ